MLIQCVPRNFQLNGKWFDVLKKTLSNTSNFSKKKQFYRTFHHTLSSFSIFNVFSICCRNFYYTIRIKQKSTIISFIAYIPLKLLLCVTAILMEDENKSTSKPSIWSIVVYFYLSLSLSFSFSSTSPLTLPQTHKAHVSNSIIYEIILLCMHVKFFFIFHLTIIIKMFLLEELDFSHAIWTHIDTEKIYHQRKNDKISMQAII